MARQSTDGQSGASTDNQTGPWVLALGVLAIGVGALVREVRRKRRTETETERGD